MNKKIEIAPEEKLAEISKDMVEIIQRADEMELKTKDDVEEATSFLALIKRRIEKVEELRKFFTKPLVDQKRNIDDLFKSKSVPLNNVYSKVKRRVADYILEERRLAQEEEERLAKLKEKKNGNREKNGKETDRTENPIVPIEVSSIRTEEGLTRSKDVWRFEVVDETKVPREFLIVDERLIRKAVNDGKREIEGVRIYKDVDIAVSINK